MRVRVFAPVYGSGERLDESGFLELPEGSRLDEVFKALRIPFPLNRLPLCLVNYRKAGHAQILADGDVVSFFSIVSGG